MKIKRLLRYCAIIMVPLLTGLFFVVGYPTNKASIDYRSLIISNNYQSLVPNDVPANHPRKNLWVLMAKVSQNDYDAVINLVQSYKDGILERSINYVFLGRAYEAKGEVDSAIVAWEESGNIDEINRSVLRLSTQKRMEDAIRVASQALVKWPDSYYRTDWLFLLAESYIDLEKWDLAINTYDKLIVDQYLGNQQKAIAYIDAGYTSYLAGKGIEVSEELVKKGILLDPKSSFGIERLGDILRQEKRYLEAKSMYVEAAQINPANSAPVIKQIDLCIYINEWDQARALIDQNLERFQDQAPFYYRLAYWYKHFEKYDDAIQAAEKSVKLDGESIWYKQYLASLYEITGSDKKALDLCQQIVMAEPGNKSAQDCIVRLK